VLTDRRRVGFLQSTVDRFLAHNEERVHRGGRFSRMTDADRAGIVDRVRCLAVAGGRFTEIAGRIAQETGRNVDTIRHTLKCFDAEDSDRATERRRGTRQPNVACLTDSANKRGITESICHSRTRD
jgi:RNA polymerase primary sigma factor